MAWRRFQKSRVRSFFALSLAAVVLSSCSPVVHAPEFLSDLNPVEIAEPENPAAAYHFVIVEGDAQKQIPNTDLPINPKVRVVDAYGNGVAGVGVTFTPDSKASVGQTLVTTDAGGYASTSMRILYSGINNDLGVGSVTVTSATAVAGTPSSVTFTSKLRPNQVVLSVGDNQTLSAGDPAGLKFYVRVKYLLVNIPGETIDWSSVAGGTFSADSGVTNDTEGRLGVNFYPLTTEGAYLNDVTAQLRGTAYNHRFTYTVKAGVATSIAIVSGDNQTVASGSSPAQPFVVSAIDQFGNRGGIKIDWKASNGVLSTLLSSTNASGQASSSGFQAPAAAGTYEMKAQAAGGSASVTFNVNVTGGCSATTGGGTITSALAVSRLSGVAPLSVFFDSTGTTSTVFSIRPFHDLEYRWDFGDSGEGTWSFGSRPGQSGRNSATGPVAAHVFRTPGTYTVALNVTDGTHTATNGCTQITVLDPDTVFSGGNTTCFSVSGNFTGCPTGASQVTTSNYAAAINTYVGTGKRLLFRRGETFTSSVSAQIAVSGPGIIGAFGSGSRPKFQFQYADAAREILLLSSSATPGLKDWRIMDLELAGEGVVGGGNGTTDQERGIVPMGGMDQVTLSNLYVHNLHNPIHWSSSVLDPSSVAAGHTLWDQLTVVDSSTANISGCSAALSFYGSGKRMAFLGNNFDNSSGGEHTVRLESAHKAVFSNNQFQGQGNCAGGKSAFTLRSTDPTDSGAIIEEGVDTHQVVISDNRMLAAPDSARPTSVAPQCGYNPAATPACDDHLNNIILERNYFQGGAGSAVGSQDLLYISATNEITVRNNLFNMNGGKGHGGISVNGNLNDVGRVMIYNNSFFSTDADNDFTALGLTSGAYGIGEVLFKNNLAYTRNDSQKWMFEDPAGDVIAAGNTCDVSRCQAAGTLDPGFAALPPLSNVDWTPSALGYAAGSGVFIPVWSDFSGAPRSSSAFNMGALIPQ